MSTEPIPESLAVRLQALINLAVEYWRLSTWLMDASPANAGPARHALRKMEDFLKLCELEVRVFAMHPFDAGMAVKVVDTIDDATLAAGKAMIEETLSPMVLWKGHVVRPAEVVTRRGVKKM